MRISGDWPGVVTIRGGWGKAVARPWNHDLLHGYVRLERGGAAFLQRASEHVLACGADLVASPPLPEGAERRWRVAGFAPFLELDLYRRTLVGSRPPTQPGVMEALPDFEALAEVDRLAFAPFWRSTVDGLRESYRSTVRRTLFLTGPGPRPEGFAIVGLSGLTAYLQRIAVLPACQGRGSGTRLILAAVRWAAQRGAAAMLLNTPPANEAAAALYRSSGFHRLPNRLRVLRYDG